MRVLSTLVQMPHEKRREVAKLLAMADYATPSLTDAVRQLLAGVHPREMTAIEVRNALEDSSNSDDLNVSLSACHAALKRMLSDSEVETGQPKNGKTTYRRVLKLPENSNLIALLAGLTSVAASFSSVPTVPKPAGQSHTPGELKRLLQDKLPRK